MEIITDKQYNALKRLKRLIQGERYKLKLTLIYATPLMPGYFSVTASTPELYVRTLKLLRKIKPDVQVTYETGQGWHTGDRTEYHFGSFDYMVK